MGAAPPPVTVGWAAGGPCSLLRAAFLRAGELALLDELPEQEVDPPRSAPHTPGRTRLSPGRTRRCPKIVGDGHAVAGAGMRVRQAPCAHAAQSDNPSAFQIDRCRSSPCRSRIGARNSRAAGRPPPRNSPSRAARQRWIGSLFCPCTTRSPCVAYGERPSNRSKTDSLASFICSISGSSTVR